MRSPLMAIACASGLVSSTVTTFPLRSTIVAGSTVPGWSNATLRSKRRSGMVFTNKMIAVLVYSRRLMWTLWQDLRYSLRLLAKHPGFTLTAVGVLTLGIGVNAGIFGIINGLMIRPLAGADAPGELVGVYSKDRTATRGYRAFSYPGFEDLRSADGPFAHLAGHNVSIAGVTAGGATRQSIVD